MEHGKGFSEVQNLPFTPVARVGCNQIWIWFCTCSLCRLIAEPGWGHELIYSLSSSQKTELSPSIGQHMLGCGRRLTRQLRKHKNWFNYSINKFKLNNARHSQCHITLHSSLNDEHWNNSWHTGLMWWYFQENHEVPCSLLALLGLFVHFPCIHLLFPDLPMSLHNPAGALFFIFWTLFTLQALAISPIQWYSWNSTFNFRELLSRKKFSISS